jgi:hypothetical protein
VYSLPNIIQVIKPSITIWAGHEAHMGKRRDAYRVLLGKPEGKTPFGRPRHRWMILTGIFKQ